MGGEIDTNDLKKIQLDILFRVREFCDNNNIEYSLAFGTLLGAVRHKGFIPWDDDIDICLTRSEYIKLEKKFPDLLARRYRFSSLYRDEEWNRPWGKIYDIRTELVERVTTNLDNNGVGIDVFPIDEVDDTARKFHVWDKMRKAILLTWSLKQVLWNPKRSFVKNLTIMIIRIIFAPIPLREMALFFDSFIQKKNGKGHNRIFASCWALKCKSNAAKSDFDNYVEKEFEGYSFKCMEGYDDFLKSVYGDYMKLPPVEKRVSHHSFNAYWK